MEARPRASSLAPLRSPIFRAIWLASLVSNFGGLVQAVGAAWMMTTITTSANMVALVQASTTLPIMVFSFAAGAIADSFNRRRVMLIAQAFMLCVSVALTVAAWMGILTPWTLLAFTFLIGCGTALNNPAWQASVGDMVPRAHLPAAVALNSVGFNLTRSVGPAIGGIIVAAAGAAAAFAVNSMSYAGLIGVLYFWRPEIVPSTLPRERLRFARSARGVGEPRELSRFRAALLRRADGGEGDLRPLAERLVQRSERLLSRGRKARRDPGHGAR